MYCQGEAEKRLSKRKRGKELRTSSKKATCCCTKLWSTPEWLTSAVRFRWPASKVVPCATSPWGLDFAILGDSGLMGLHWSAPTCFWDQLIWDLCCERWTLITGNWTRFQEPVPVWWLGLLTHNARQIIGVLVFRSLVTACIVFPSFDPTNAQKHKAPCQTSKQWE